MTVTASNGVRKFSGYFAIIAFLIFLSFIFYSIDEIFIQRTLVEIERFEVRKGEGADSVINRLEEEGLIRNEFLTKSFILFTGIHKKIKPGVYSIGPSYSVSQIFYEFAEGVKDEIRIFEGFTVKEISEVLKEKGLISSSAEFRRLVSNFDNSDGRYAFLPQKKGINLEGYLFPDTYEFQGLSPDEIIEKMLVNFEKKVLARLDIFERKNLQETIIIASMLEKEVRAEKDMKLVSGILWKRLEAGIALQVDATLVYIKCSILNRANCRSLTDSDKRLNSPYNTYLHRELPLGPISNPGLTAIEAAFDPERSPYLYYLSARDDGRTIFSRTLEEHNLNRSVYR
ncbi:MAG: endolytic transglycosylase MltG [Patescibacteria group bacterium]